MKGRVILAVEEGALRTALAQGLRHVGLSVELVLRKRGWWTWLSTESCDAVLVSRSMIPDPLRRRVREFVSVPGAAAIVVLAVGADPIEQADLRAAGCQAILDAGCVSPTGLVEAVNTIVRQRHSLKEPRSRRVTLAAEIDRPTLGDFSSLVPAMQRLLNQAERVATSDVSVLVLGETGVGKEYLARAIHNQSPRSSGPFVAINCAAIPESLLESELFGHEEGAFTGARAHRGVFEMAHRGTLLLDEIGDLPHHLQAKLLRVLEERSVRRLGSERAIPIDVRIIAATNRELDRPHPEKVFRSDLYYRLTTIKLFIPPLRERAADIPTLVQRHLQSLRSRMATPVNSVSVPAMAALKRYHWPGNIRELVNVLERCMLLSHTAAVECEDLPDEVCGAPNKPNSDAHTIDPVVLEHGLLPADWVQTPLLELKRAMTERVERMYLDRILREERGLVGRAAERAGINPRSLYLKMRRYGFAKETYRTAES